MKIPVLFTIILMVVVSCQSSPEIKEGYWTGTLTPMNHPEMANPLDYKVTTPGDEIKIDIIGPDSSLIPTRHVRVENDTLFFEFNEPEEEATLDCVLARHESPQAGFAGRCTDTSGQWARFTMIEPN